MKKYKIYVYAICKNEEAFVERWVNSMSEADEIIVLDTGSTDKTVELLKAFPKVKVYEETISPWRFDTARNKSLEKVPSDADICVCTDLDEVFVKGWRKILEKALEKKPQLVSYRYVWSFNADGSENTVFNIEKIHSRFDFKWVNPVHEVLEYTKKGTAKSVYALGMQLNHFPDSNKSRGQYLELLELAVKETPENDRNMHYLGREYMFYKNYPKAIETLKRHLSLKTAVWKDERCASMRYIANCYEALGENKLAFLWRINAICEAEYLREPYIETAMGLYREKNWYGVIFFMEKALEITTREENYISNANAWSEMPYDILSIAYYYVNDINKSIENAKKALSISPNDERIKANLDFYSKKGI